MAVRCQRRVGSVGRSARSLVIGLVRRHIGARSYRVHRRIGMRLVGLYELGYRGSLALVNEDKASGASANGGCADGGCVGGACTGGGCTDGARADGGCADGGQASRAVD